MVVSNEYGRDSERIWVWVVDRTIVRPSVAASEAGGKNGPGLEEINTISVQLAPSDVITEGIYYSWAVETYLSRLSAQSATREYAQLGLSHVRVYEDDSGSGSTAFRVLLGRYGTQKQAVIRKKNLESLVERPLSLITIRG